MDYVKVNNTSSKNYDSKFICIALNNTHHEKLSCNNNVLGKIDDNNNSSYIALVSNLKNSKCSTK